MERGNELGANQRQFDTYHSVAEIRPWPHKTFDRAASKDYTFINPFLPFFSSPEFDFDPIEQCIIEHGIPSSRWSVDLPYKHFDYSGTKQMAPFVLQNKILAIPAEECDKVFAFIVGTAVAFEGSVMAYRVQRLSLVSQLGTKIIKPSDEFDEQPLVPALAVISSVGKTFHMWGWNHGLYRYMSTIDQNNDWGNVLTEVSRTSDDLARTKLDRIDFEIPGYLYPAPGSEPVGDLYRDEDDDEDSNGIGDGEAER